MDVAIALLVIAITLGVAYVSCVKSENRDLKAYVEFYRKQLQSVLASLDRGNECLQGAASDYSELAGEYRELYVAYKRAYEILAENDLLPGDEE